MQTSQPSSDLFNSVVLAITMCELARVNALVNICEAESGMLLAGKQPPELAYEKAIRESVPLILYAYQSNQQPGGFRSFGNILLNPKGDFADQEDFAFHLNGWEDKSNPLHAALDIVQMLRDTADDHEITSLHAVAKGFAFARDWLWRPADGILLWSVQ